MAKLAVIYKTGKTLPAVPVRALFRKTGFNDWFSPGDVRWYLRHALYVASAWAGQQCVGIAVLTGDGRIAVWLDLLVVDQEFRGRGVGSKLTALVTTRITQLQPYHASVDVFERRTERFYARFGFTRNKGTWLLHYGPTADRLRELAHRARAARGGASTPDGPLKVS